MIGLGPLAKCLLLLLLSAAPTTRTARADDPRVTAVVRAYRDARPAVVNISAEKVMRTRLGLGGFEDLFSEIFRTPLSRQVPVESLGSGFVLHPSGYIVTNAHVVRQAQRIAVTTAEGKKHAARVISADPAHDLAVLKIDPPEGEPMPHLPLGRSDDLMVGETVIAIGNPLGYANTLTTGVISAVNRTLHFRGGVKYAGIIQIDAPINPGSSGGALLNINGDLIGINTAIRADAQNIGFAIPVDTLAAELPALLDFERINRVVFGARLVQRHTPRGDEVVVEHVSPGTPAAGRLRVGDRVVALNGRPVRQITDFTCPMLAVKPGEAVRLTCARGRREVAVTVAVKAKPRPDGERLARRLFGMSLRPVTPDLRSDHRLAVDRGLMVVGLEEGGPADRLGLRLKDVIFQVGRYYVADLDDLGTILEDLGWGESVMLGILRGSQAIWTPIRARRPPPATTRPAPRGAR
jgi:serine protease Do